ncbi:MAG: alpha/beta hydrolase [Proteobacteria bacterium]|nr:MAG: alpha/beta hydrolase [Pseudomonadota bacterium]
MIEKVAGDAALHLDVEGDGEPTLLLMHGFGGSARNWRPQQRALRDRFRVAALDVRGHARSEAPRDAVAYRPERFVADVARALDHLGCARAVVGGLSMGAGIAARFAIAHPARVRGLVLTALPPGADEGTRQRSWALAFADAIERDGLDAAGARFAWGSESGLDAGAAKLVKLGFAEHAPHALAHTLRELLAVQPGAETLAEALAPLRLPVLLVVGERDPVSVAVTRRLAAALPDAALVVVPGAGHAVNLEARDATSDALRAFLERVS